MSHFQQEKFVEIASEYLNLTCSKKVFDPEEVYEGQENPTVL